MKRLIIARHGNTFRPDQIPTRVGCHTDLPLVEQSLGRNIGGYLRNNGIKLNNVYAAPLKRTMQTAELILDELPQPLSIQPLSDFLEIDYGLDENKTEDQVIMRLGLHELALAGHSAPSTDEIIRCGNAVIERWNNHGEVPYGWQVDVNKIISTWQTFAEQIQDNETVLVVTSNGIIRFAPHILNKDHYDKFMQMHSLKVKTGSLSIFEYEQDIWNCSMWNKRPA